MSQQAWYLQNLYANVLYMDGTEQRIPLNVIERDGKLFTSFPEQADWSVIRRVDYAPEFGTAAVGDAGYYVLPHGQKSAGDSFLCRFREREDSEYISENFIMPIWGCIRPGKSFLAIVTSMTYEYFLKTSVYSGKYTNYASFLLDGRPPYEPIEIVYYLLREDADYNDVALAYRTWREQRGEIHSIRDRAANRAALQYSADSIYIRIRQAWKPVPSPVAEQTPENEPPLHVAATFANVSALIDDFAREGIHQAEICLVGWNRSGHDGRWPQAFPVEKALGGEKALLALTEKAREKGYAMVCHTNSTDAYSIADIWEETELIRGENGIVVKNDQGWSGGDMYWVCPICGLRQARAILPQVRALNFAGTHYIDVVTTIFPRACHDPAHPVTRRECAELWNRILRFARDTFGGISSEGGYDFAAPELDFGLYISFGMNECSMADECIPLWQLVYHGYVLSNPYTKTVNPTEEQLMKLTEYGGRPTFYYDSQFVTPDPEKDVNWMGAEDFHCRTEKDRTESVRYIAKVDRWYQQIKHLQMIPMNRHEMLPGNVRKVTYGNGDVVMVDYGAGTAFLNEKRILPLED